MHLSLEGSQLKQLDKVDLGEGVRVVIEGVVTSWGENEYDGRVQGHICVEYTRMRLVPTDNEFSRLVEDE